MTPNPWRSTRDDPPAVGQRVEVRDPKDDDSREVTVENLLWLEHLKMYWPEWRPAEWRPAEQEQPAP